MSVRDLAAQRADYVRFPPGQRWRKKPPKDEDDGPALTLEDLTQAAENSWALVAKFDGTCARCQRPIVAASHRIRPTLSKPRRWLHVECAVGAPPPG